MSVTSYCYWFILLKMKIIKSLLQSLLLLSFPNTIYFWILVFYISQSFVKKKKLNFRSASIYFIFVHVSCLTDMRKKNGVKRKVGTLFWASHKKIPDPLGGELKLEQKVTASFYKILTVLSYACACWFCFLLSLLLMFPLLIPVHRKDRGAERKTTPWGMDCLPPVSDN